MSRDLSSAAFVAALLLAGLGACRGTTTPFSRGGRSDASGGAMPTVPLPNAPAGDARARGEGSAAAPSSTEPAPTPQARAQLRRVAEQRLRTARSLWERATSLEAARPLAAAPLFDRIVTSYPEYERAAESRFRQGQALYRGRAYAEAIEALQAYMLIAPVNPHLAEVEEMMYESGRRTLGARSGPFGLFGSDQAGLSALKFVAQNFPAGNYPDDALLALANYYRCDEDFENAALTFRELLIRYPDSEWSFRARLALADTYMARDHGTPYNAGFVMLDPREPVPAELAVQAGPVEQAVMLALREYEIFLERMEADPARRAEYANEIAYAQRRAQEARERIAAKDLDRADWYRGRGDMSGAITYWRLAAHWNTTRAGRLAAQRLQAALPAPASRPAPR